jgi:hypothetical protein|nr:MAG TPA: hypothetical protein [Caudoviricetes sp.]
MSEPIIAYKGFDKDMKCRGFQYEEGKTYHTPGAVLCKEGAHACTMPLDVLGYYPPGDGSIYRMVELDEVCDEKSDDSKVCAKTIKIGAEIGIPGLVKAQIEWVKNTIGFDEKIKKAKGSPDKHATGYWGAASATGTWGAASATGEQGAASATGTRGAASATGYWGAASATGTRGAASATGEQGAASATGNWGAASATGEQGAASATGTWGAASATGYQGAASATGKASVAMASGRNGRVMGTIGCAIFAVERGEWDGNTYKIISVAAGIVDGVTIKEKTWYKCVGGKFVEV